MKKRVGGVGAALTLVSLVLALAVFPSSVSAGQDIWTTNTLYGYQVNVIALDPQTPSIVYAGTQEGLLVSLNGGGKWSAVRSMLNPVTAIVPHPEVSGWLYVVASGLVYRTNDFGNRWAPLGKGMIDRARLIVLDPKTPDTIYVGTDSGLFRSRDGGESWAGAGVPAQGRPLAVVIDPQNSEIVLVSVERQGLFKSTDGGKSWLLTGNGLPQGSPPPSLAIHPQTPNILYAAGGDYSYRGRVYKSTDDDDNWTVVGQPEKQEVHSVFLVPQVPDVLYGAVRGGGLYRSPDGGVSWALIGKGLPERRSQITQLVGDPQNAKVLYAVANSQVYKSYDNGENWIGYTLPGRITTLVTHPVSPQTLCIGTDRDGVYRSTDGGNTWADAKGNLPETASTLCPAFDRLNPDTTYAGVGSLYFRSTDGGRHWDSLNLPPNTKVLDIATDPKTSTTIYVASEGGLLKSTNGGESWSLTTLPVQRFSQISVAIMHEAPTTLYIAISSYYENLTLIKSDDGGVKWQQVANVRGKSVVFHPRKPSTMLVPAGGQGVLVSSDSGARWENKNLGLPQRVDAWRVVIHPMKELFFLVTNYGIYVSSDPDAGWALLHNGWPSNRQASILAITADDPPQLFVLDSAGTLWQYTMSTVPQPPTPTPSPSPTLTPTPRPTNTPCSSPTPWPTPTRRVMPAPTDTSVLQGAISTPTATPESVARTTATPLRRQATPTRQPAKAEESSVLPWMLGGIALLGLLAAAGFVALVLRGRKPQAVYCTNCGASNTAGSRFCIRCGTELPPS
jgi:photosystem II stability/assembly factor-like uncharacterized protein